MAQRRPWFAVLGRAATVFSFVLTLMGLFAAPAAAHPALVSSEPADGYVLSDPPRELVFRFSEPVGPAAGPLLRLAGTAGEDMPMAVTFADASGDAAATGPLLRGRPGRPLPSGQYVARYEVVAQDGDVITGQVAFTLGTAGGAQLGSAGSPAVDLPVASLRWLLFSGLALGLGGLVVAWRIDAIVGGSPPVRPLVRAGAFAAVAGVVGLLLRTVDLVPQALRLAATQPGGPQLLLVQLVLLLVAALAARRPWRGTIAFWALLGAVLVEGLRAHPRALADAWGFAITVVHLVAASLWAGGLVHALRVMLAWREDSDAVRRAVLAYARVALTAAVTLLLTGAVAAVLLLGSWDELWATAYGRTVSAKVALVVLVLVAAAAARVRLRGPAQISPTLVRPVGYEAAALAAVLLASAALTSITPPKLVPASSMLSAPRGPVLRVADRAEQVTVSAVASNDRLDLRAYVPDDGRPVRYELSVGVTGPGSDQQQWLSPDGCGTGCWTAQTSWGSGRNTVTVDVRTDRWRGGRIQLQVDWPVLPAPDAVARVRAAMAAQRVIATRETVTSGFGVPAPTTSERPGVDYVAGQPWTSGGATDAVIIVEGGVRTLLFALPALGYHFRMVLDEQDRVVSERIVTPNHLLLRQHTFPQG